MTEKVGLIGLDNMGRAMAKRLLNAGFDLLINGTNDTKPKALKMMLDLGAKKASSTHELASACDRILLSLPTSPDVEKVTLGKDGIIEAAEQGTVVIDTGAANPIITRRIAHALAVKGIEMLDAPVTGGSIDCEAGILSMMVGGKREMFEQCHPILSSIAPKNLKYIGDIGSGHVMKLAHDIVAFTSAWAVTEGMVLSARAGLSCKKVLEVINVSSGRSYHTALTFPRYMLTGKIKQGLTIGRACHNIDLAVEHAKDLGVPFFVGNKTRELYHNVLAKWGSEQDANEILTRLEDWVGVTVRPKTHLQGSKAE